MKSLFNRTAYEEIRQRIENITPQNTRKWGKMSLAQMLAHCAIGFEHATGKVPFKDKSNFIMRGLVKRLVLNAVKKGDLGQNQKTFPEFLITDEHHFDTEKKRLLNALDAFYESGKQGNVGRHPHFGKFSNEDWGALQYVHTDHHLAQFSA